MVNKLLCFFYCVNCRAMLSHPSAWFMLKVYLSRPTLGETFPVTREHVWEAFMQILSIPESQEKWKPGANLSGSEWQLKRVWWKPLGFFSQNPQLQRCSLLDGKWRTADQDKEQMWQSAGGKHLSFSYPCFSSSVRLKMDRETRCRSRAGGKRNDSSSWAKTKRR